MIPWPPGLDSCATHRAAAVSGTPSVREPGQLVIAETWVVVAIVVPVSQK